MLQPDGPLLGLGLVAEANGDGSFSVPQLLFTTDDTVATAVVILGDDIPAESTLTVAWYRLQGVDERTHLFSHEIPIGPGGHAFSQGVAEGGLAPGLYETVATLGDHLVRTPWVVRVGSDVAPLGAVSGTFGFLFPTALAQSGDEDWNVPDSGDSGWYDPESSTGEPSPPGPCTLDSINPSMSPMTILGVAVYWRGTCSHMTLTATVSGPPQTLNSREITEQAIIGSLGGRADVCELPGGNDLLGTIVHLAAMGSETTGIQQDFTLPDLGEALVTALEARPAVRSRVEPGQTIDFHALAMLMPPVLGIEKLSLYAGDELIDSTGNHSGSDRPEPCDLGRYSAEIESIGRYRVPDDPPPVIEICARARGFDGTEATDCGEFYTGEVWKGMGTGQSYVPYCSPSKVPVTGDIEFVVGDDGTVTGSATKRGGGFSSCQTPTGELIDVPVPDGTFPISGRRTGEVLELNMFDIYGKTVTAPIVGTHATVTFDGTGPGGVGGFKITYTIDCVTCG